ncbi:MAG: hypothetical protein AB1782_02945, partial [Cyanobacteriota bacterium]
MNKFILTTIISLLLLSSVVLAEDGGPDKKHIDEITEIKLKYPGKFDAFYSLTYKMTPQERELFQKTVKKLEAEKKFNDLLKQENDLKEKVLKANSKYILDNNGRMMTQRDIYREKFLAIKQQRIDAGIKYSVLKQEQAEEEEKYSTNYQELFQKEEELRKKLYTASNTMSIQAKDGRIMSEYKIISEQYDDIIKQRMDVAKKVALLSEDKYFVGGIKQLCPRKPADPDKEKNESLINADVNQQLEPTASSNTGQNWGNATQEPTASSNTGQSWGNATQEPTASSNTGQNWGNTTQEPTASSNTGQNWGNATQEPTASPNTGQNWGNATQEPIASSNTGQNWGNATQEPIASSNTAENDMNLVKDYITAQQGQNEVTTIAPGSSKIISQDLINLAHLNAKNKNASFGTAMGEYVSGIPENVLDEAFKMSSVKGLPG